MLETLSDAASMALTFNNLFGAALGIFLGSFLGAVPGLNGTMAIALLIPVTYTWTPLFSISMLIGCWKGSVYGGSISAILLNAPGTPEAAATALDGYPLTQQGKAGKALKMALYASVTAANLSDSLLMIEHPEMIYGLFMLLIISDFFMLIIPIPLMKIGQWVITVPRSYLFPVILILCGIGAYGTHQNMFEVKVMVFFGILGYFMKKWGLSPAALLIAFILGPMAEVYLRQVLMISGGNPSIFIMRPLAAVFLALTVTMIIWTIYRQRQDKKISNNIQ